MNPQMCDNELVRDIRITSRSSQNPQPRMREMLMSLDIRYDGRMRYLGMTTAERMGGEQ